MRILSSHPVARGEQRFSPLLKKLFYFFFEPIHSSVNSFLRNAERVSYFAGRIALYFHQGDLQGQLVHLNQNLIELLVFDTVQKVFNRLYFGLLRIIGNSIKICTRLLHTLVVPPVRIENRPIVSAERFDGAFVNSELP